LIIHFSAFKLAHFSGTAFLNIFTSSLSVHFRHHFLSMSHATSYNIFLKIIVSSITFNFFILYVIACLVHLEDIIALSIISKKQLILKRLRDLLLIHRLVHAQMATFNIFLFFCFDEMF